MARVIKDQALAEITLRKYEKPYELEERDLIRKICLSLGLLQPGDSRDVIVDVLQFIVRSGKEVTSDEVVEGAIANRKKYKLDIRGTAASNVRRQIKRLRDLFLVEKVGNNYRITENASLLEIFEEKLEKFYIQTIIRRVKDYLKEVKHESR
ncbi:MAG: hypothetical protein ACE5FT_01105 [Candidatus Nanoarchaeia archaeon]